MIQLTKFVKLIQEAFESLQEEEDAQLLHFLYMWNRFQPEYSDYMEERIQKWFQNLVSDYFQEEIKVVQKYLQVRSQVVMMTQYLSYVQDYISDFALNVSQSLAGERLFDLLKICALKGPIDFAKTLLHQA